MVARSAHATQQWMAATLTLAGVYNLLWGAFVIAFPQTIFRWTAIEDPRYPQIWQCVGMLVGAYGLAYLIAARDPYRHWPIVLVGLLGKIAGPIGFVASALAGTLPWIWGLTIVTNDLIWWLPFASILYFAYRHNTNPRIARGHESMKLDEAIKKFRSHRGATLAELSVDRPVMVVFLRHPGCTFCREALSDLAQQRSEIEAGGVQLAIVHMCEPMHATRLTAKNGLDDVHRFSDADCELYEAFGLQRGTLRQLIGVKVFLRGFVASMINGHGMGTIASDGFQMPGAFVLSDGRVVTSYCSKSAADRPDYLSLADSAVRKIPSTVGV